MNIHLVPNSLNATFSKSQNRTMRGPSVSVVYFQGAQEIAVVHCCCKITSAILFFLIKLKFLGCSVSQHLAISNAANYFWTIPSMKSNKFIVFSRAPRNCGRALLLQEHKCNTFFSYQTQMVTYERGLLWTLSSEVHYISKQ